MREGKALLCRRARAAAGALITSVAAAACGGATPGATMAANAKIAREEQRPDKLLQRGRGFAAIHDYTRAEQYLSAAMSAGVRAEVVLPLLLQVCIEEKRYRAALLYAEPQLSTHPDDFRLRFLVASLYASIGETSTALDHLQRIAQTRPDDAEVQYAMGVIYRDTVRDPVLADGHFRDYLRVAPQGRHALEARASLLKQVADAAPVTASDAKGTDAKGTASHAKGAASDAPPPAPIGSHGGWKSVP